MKTRILLCAGLLAMGATITLGSNRVTAKGLIQSNSRSMPKNAIVSQKNAEYYRRSGVAKHDRGNYLGAIADLNRAIELDPNFARAYSNRGNTKDELGDSSGAIADYNRAIELNPKYDGAYLNRGITKYNLGDYQGSIADYNKLLKINPNNSDAYNARGVSRNKLGDYSGAIADFDRAVKINPNNSLALDNANGVRAALRRNQEQNTLDHINRVQNAQTCCK